MIRSILVPLDGSRFAEHVLPTAVSLARAAGAQLSLLMVHEPSTARVPVAAPTDPPSDDVDRRGAEGSYLVETAHRLGSLKTGPVKYRLVDGVAADAIANEVAAGEPDLIVMSAHGRGALSRFWLGSVVDRLVRRVAAPILLLKPADERELAGTALGIRRILVALDGSKESEAILRIVKPIAEIGGAHLTLFHVVDAANWVYGSLAYPMPVQPDQLETASREAQRYLDRLADRLRADGLAVAARVEIGASPAASLLHELDRKQFDLIALTTHGAGGFRRLMLGSVADKVIRAATKPILIVRPPDLQSAGSAA